MITIRDIDIFLKGIKNKSMTRRNSVIYKSPRKINISKFKTIKLKPIKMKNLKNIAMRSVGVPKIKMPKFG